MRISPRNRAAAAGQSLLIDTDRALALDRALAGIMARIIAYACDVDGSIASDVDVDGFLAYARDADEDRFLAYARDIGLDVDRDSSLASDVNRALNGLRDFDRDRDRDLALGIASDVDRVLSRLRDFDRFLNDLRDFAVDRALPNDRDFDRDLDRTLDLGRALARDLTIARGSALAVAHTGEGERAAERQRRMVPLAERLLSAGALLLPASDRDRYAEEFRSELTEIARAGARRRSQLAYAARVVMSAPRLRADLRAPRRRGAVP